MDKKRILKENIADLLKNFRIWVLIFFIFISLVAINYTFSEKGVVINGITPASYAESAGLSYDSTLNLRSLEKIISINNQKIKSVEEFYLTISEIEENSTIILKTDKNTQGYTIEIGDLKNETTIQALGINVREAVTSNIRLGIELEGGSRLILKPEKELSVEDFDLLINTLQSRLDVYGASGTKVNRIEDSFTGDRFVIVESTSSNKNDIFTLIGKQGKFEAKVANVTVFTGENVIRVFNDPQHARLEGCSKAQEGYVCSFAFQVEINSAGGDQFFEQTQKLDVDGDHLSEKIYFYLDGKEITGLNIAKVFKYQKITNPQITVSGNPVATQEKAVDSAKKEMKFLQAILSTQTLPTELEVVQSYSISSSLGKELLENALWVGLAALLLVAGVVAIRYKNPLIFIGILTALIGEIVIVFGVAAFMRLSIDLAAIGGIIAAIGTGVDDQIIITDEYFRKDNKNISGKGKIKKAFYIIMIAYFTTIAAMIPLSPLNIFSGIKLLEGFAFMIIAGVTIGVLISRPAYAAMLRIFLSTRSERHEEEAEDE